MVVNDTYGGGTLPQETSVVFSSHLTLLKRGGEPTEDCGGGGRGRNFEWRLE